MQKTLITHSKRKKLRFKNKHMIKNSIKSSNLYKYFFIFGFLFLLISFYLCGFNTSKKVFSLFNQNNNNNFYSKYKNKIDSNSTCDILDPI